MLGENETADRVVTGAAGDEPGAPVDGAVPSSGAAPTGQTVTDRGVPDRGVPDRGASASGDSAGGSGDEGVPAGGPGGSGESGGETGGEASDTSGAAADPVTALRAERDEYLDSLRRLQAEFDNYRKRVAKQQAEQADRAALVLVDKLLPVLDALELAATHLGDPESGDAKALLAASSLLNGALAKEGLERVDPLGEPFDPNAHEAVGHMPDEEVAPVVVPGGDPAPAGVDGRPGPDDGAPGTADPAAAGGTAGSGEAGSTAGPAAVASTGDAAAAGSTAPGPVVGQVMRAGYRWKGTVVRPAMVMVRG